jgi:hypothetical protein
MSSNSSNATQRRGHIKTTIDADDARHKRQKQTLTLRRTARDEVQQQRRRCIESAHSSKIAAVAPVGVLPNDLVQCQTMNEENTALLPTYIGYLANDVLCSQNANVWLVATVGIRKLLSKMDPSSTVCAIMEQGQVVIGRLVAGVSHENPMLAYESTWALINLANDARCIAAILHMGALPALMRLLVSTTQDEIRSRCLWAIRNIAASDRRDHPQLVLASTNIIAFVVPILASPHRVSFEYLAMACDLLANIARFRAPLEHFISTVLPVTIPLIHTDQKQDVALSVRGEHSSRARIGCVASLLVLTRFPLSTKGASRALSMRFTH